jgi:hypothetical protein
MRSSALVLGYHGCDREIGERILSGGGHLRASENDYDWLGSGIYFWEDNPKRAMEWAEFVKANPKLSRAQIRDPFVIGAIINPGNCLDLMEADSIRIVEESYQRFAMVLKAASLPLPKNQRKGGEWAVRRLDCAVLNYVHTFGVASGKPEFDTVRAAFEEGEPLYPTAGFHRRTHIQLCVRNTAQIIGYFRPMAE